ncbi:hypothetical protein QCA50_011574 [Cerrena zonata]|uniref:Maturase n=1 Tax=Cerrena zonata TaxID=2478898 RepID=A0AAW0FWD0_9APHY
MSGKRSSPHLQFNRTRCSLQSLAISFDHHPSTILDHFIKAGPFIASLKHILIAFNYGHVGSIFQEILALLHHCSHSLEELNILNGYISETSFLEGSLQLSKTFSAVSFTPYISTHGGAEKHFDNDAEQLDNLLSSDSFPRFRTFRLLAN